MNPEHRLVPPGVALIGVTYGLARFAYGLFLPAMRADVGLTPTLAGVIGGASYAGYCVAILVAAILSAHLGPRPVACLAGTIAAGGMALIALSPTPAILAVGVLTAGMSTGLASPPLADSVARLLVPSKRPRANTLINSGTSVGVAVSGPVALIGAEQWRLAYGAFAATAALVTIWVTACAPRRNESAMRRAAERGASQSLGGLWRAGATALVIAATAMGGASAIYWTFAAEVIVRSLGPSTDLVSGFWVLIGLAGFAGASAGDLIQRYGINAVHRAALLALAVAIGLFAVPSLAAPAMVASAALFGAAYIMLTGVYLVWGVQLYSDRPAIGVGLPFLMIAVGQVLGSPFAGYLIGTAGHRVAFLAFATLAVATMAVHCTRAVGRCSNTPDHGAGRDFDSRSRRNELKASERVRSHHG